MNNIIFSGISNKVTQQFIEQFDSSGCKNYIAKKIVSGLEVEKKGTGWVNTKSLSELQAHYPDEKNYFLVFYCSPEYYLAEASRRADDGGKEINLTNESASWHREFKLIIDFYVSNSEQVILVDIESCFANIDKILELLNKKFELSIDAKNESKNFNYENQLSKFANECITQSVMLSQINEAFELQECYEELEAAADVGSFSQDSSFESRLQARLDSVVHSIEQLGQQYVRVKRELKTAKSAVSDYKQKDIEQLKELEQLKKELESLFSLHTKAKKEKEELLTSKKQLATEHEKIILESLHLREELLKLSSDNQDLEVKLSKYAVQREESRSDSELVELQLKQLQEELESISLENKRLIDDVGSLNNKNRSLTAEKQGVEQQYIKLQQEIETQQKQLERLTRDNRDSQRNYSDVKCDNEIALLQIKQLQDELEFYFNAHQKAEEWKPLSHIPELSRKQFQSSLKLRRLLN